MRRVLTTFVVGLGIAYAASGVYEVKPEETGVAYVFGRALSKNVPPGIHWNLPAPFGREAVRATRLSQVLRLGHIPRGVQPANLSQRRDMWLTGGASLVEAKLDIQYSIAQLDRFLLVHEEPEAFVELEAERAISRFFAGRPVDDVLTTSRQTLASEVFAVLQRAIDDADLGIVVQDVSVAHLAPPQSGGVFNAFREVQSARSERERALEQARSESARIVFDAGAEAEANLSQAHGEQFARVEQAKAEAERFVALARERKNAPEVTETRLFRDIIPEVLRRTTLYVVPNDTDRVTIE